MKLPKTDHRLSLLIADDDVAWRETVDELFCERFTTLVVPTGAEAIEILAGGEADVALCDVHMGAVTGLDVAAFVCERELFVPCVLMTARPTDDVLREAAACGVETVLHKPVGRDELMATVLTAADRTLGFSA